MIWGDVAHAIRTELRGEIPRSCSIARELIRKGVPMEDIVDVCKGARYLVERGRVSGIAPGDPISLRQLRPTVKGEERKGWKVGDRWLWDVALEHQRRADAPPPTVRGTKLNRVGVDLSRIGR